MNTEAKQFYKTYEADDSLSPLSDRLIIEIMKFLPERCFEFGMGTGKHLNILHKNGVCTRGTDISVASVAKAIFKYNLPCVGTGDETHLRHEVNHDVVFTCSVLDHIIDIDGIIGEFKRIAVMGIVLAETNDVPGPYYYPHDYEDYGFTKLDFEWLSDGDGARYNIWTWQRPEIIEDDNFNRE